MPNWDILIISIWENCVKELIAIFRLKQLRKERQITQVKLSLDLNMSQNTISRYENGVRNADYNTLIQFADYFDVSLDYLLGRTDNPKMNR